jgi:hypothetical protein
MSDHDVAQFLTRRVHAAEPPFTLDADAAIVRGNRMRTERRRRRVFLTAAGAVVAGVGLYGALSLGGITREPEPASIPAGLEGTMTITPVTTQPGHAVELRFPEDSHRGIAFSLSEWHEGRWKLVYYLTSDWGEPGHYEPDWWTVEESENRGWHQVGISGTGPDRVVVPDTAAPRDYLLCTANAVTEACALLKVTAGPASLGDRGAPPVVRR